MTTPLDIAKAALNQIAQNPKACGMGSLSESISSYASQALSDIAAIEQQGSTVAGEAVAYLKVSNISNQPTGVFLNDGLDRELKTERLEPLYRGSQPPSRAQAVRPCDAVSTVTVPTAERLPMPGVNIDWVHKNQGRKE